MHPGACDWRRMPKYLVKASYSAEGTRGLLKDGGTGRKNAIEGLINSVGGSVEAFYYAFGDDDLIWICDLPTRSDAIATYALCGFANFGSIAVMIGGIGGLVPDRRKDFATYGFRSLIGGALAAFMTAAVAGMLI